jgi:predicted small integral membrane protein
MRIIRLSKTTMVAAIALFASLVAFGNVTDYGTNWAFVQHVLSMDTVFPTTTIKYRAIDAPALQTAGHVLIIAAEQIAAQIAAPATLARIAASRLIEVV